MCRTNFEMYGDILSSTSGVIFLGTPHQGVVDAAGLVRFLSKVVNSLKIQESGCAPKELQLWSTELMDYAKDFSQIVNRLAVWSFFETHKTADVRVSMISCFVFHQSPLDSPGINSVLHANETPRS